MPWLYRTPKKTQKLMDKITMKMQLPQRTLIIDSLASIIQILHMLSLLLSGEEETALMRAEMIEAAMTDGGDRAIMIDTEAAHITTIGATTHTAAPAINGVPSSCCRHSLLPLTDTHYWR